MTFDRVEPLTPEIMTARVGVIIQHVCRNLQAVEVCERGRSTYLSPAMFASAVKRHLQDHYRGSDLAVIGDTLMLTLGAGMARRFSPEAPLLQVPFADFWAAVSELYVGTKGFPALTVPEANGAILIFARIVNKEVVEPTRPVELPSSLAYGTGNVWS